MSIQRNAQAHPPPDPATAAGQRSGHGDRLNPAVEIIILLGGCSLGAAVFAHVLGDVVAATSASDPRAAHIVATTAAKIIFAATLPAAVGTTLTTAFGRGRWARVGALLTSLGAILTTVAALLAWMLLAA